MLFNKNSLPATSADEGFRLTHALLQATSSAARQAPAPSRLVAGAAAHAHVDEEPALPDALDDEEAAAAAAAAAAEVRYLINGAACGH